MDRGLRRCLTGGRPACPALPTVKEQVCAGLTFPAVGCWFGLFEGDDDRFIKQAYQSPGRSVSFLPPTCSRLPGTGASILLAYGQWDLTKAFLVLGGSCLLVPAALAGRASCRSPPDRPAAVSRPLPACWLRCSRSPLFVFTHLPFFLFGTVIA